ITLLDQREFLGDDLAAAGCWSARTPTEEERRDVERGLGLARQAAEARIGQTVVLRRGAIAAVEALEGTTEAIRRGTALAGPGAVIVKAVAPDHDYRFDTPVVGSESLRAAAAGRASVVAVEAGRVLVVEGRRACGTPISPGSRSSVSRMAADGPSIMLAAGEASGDLHGAALCQALRAEAPGCRLLGMGGDRMPAAGIDLLVDVTAAAPAGGTGARQRSPLLCRGERRR